MAIFRKETNSIQQSDLIFKKISESNDDIVHTKDFRRKLSQKYDGFLVYDKSDNLIGYYWYTINTPPPTSIPKIPKNTPWRFNVFVFEEHRGHGYQKEMSKHALSYFKDYKYFYCDILLDNAPSLKNILKMGYEPCGIYYILIFGIRRYKYLNFKIGYWDKNKKHKYKF